MPLIDNDLLSIQEARILLEHAEESQGVLEGLGDGGNYSYPIQPVF